jgi:hypothetical protein
MAIEEDMLLESAVDVYTNDVDLLNVDDDNLDVQFDSNMNKPDGALRQ